MEIIRQNLQKYKLSCFQYKHYYVPDLSDIHTIMTQWKLQFWHYCYLYIRMYIKQKQRLTSV